MLYFLLFCTSIVLITPETNAQVDYNALVIDYSPSVRVDNRERILKNIDNYILHYATEGHNQNTKIVVFPEYGLTGLVDDPEGYAIVIPEPNTPLNGSVDEVLIRLSAIAKEQQQYLVVNLLEKEPNSTFFYNTNVVFDRSGNLIAKYRKINLYNEPKLTPGNKIVTFTTDFGVTFGLITGYDILFKNPARDIFKDPKVTDIAHPTSWVSTMPFWVSTSVQSGYSQANGVNLLASGYSLPSKGTGGSGIYHKIGEKNAFISGESVNKAISDRLQSSESKYKHECIAPRVETGPRSSGIPNRLNISDFKTSKLFDVSKYELKKVDISQGHIEDTICKNDFCCKFKINVTRPGSNDFYKLVAHNGVIESQPGQLRVQICALIACSSGKDEDCGERVEPTTVFSKIEVETTFQSDLGSYMQPTTLTSTLLPTQNNFCNSTSGTNQIFKLATKASESSLLTFGLMGQVNAVGAANLYTINVLLLVFAAVFKNLL